MPDNNADMRADTVEKLRAVTARHLGDGLKIVDADIAVGGGSNRTWTFDTVLKSGERLPLIFRQETYAGPHNGYGPQLQSTGAEGLLSARRRRRPGRGVCDGTYRWRNHFKENPPRYGDFIGALQAIDLGEFGFLGPDLVGKGARTGRARHAAVAAR
jgi:hypothetical protein